MDANTRSPIKSNWFVKYFDVLFAGISLVATVVLIIGLVNPILIYRWGISTYIIYALPFAVALIFACAWHFTFLDSKINSAKLHAGLLGILRYWLAYEISVYGFAKILKTQFGIMHSRSDTVVSSLSGIELTWHYFGFSYTLAVILGLLQIGGSVLLLFRRTTLLSICVLMPVMINIVLINIFYSISKGAFINSVIITAGLTYLLVLRLPQLVTFFFKRDNLPALRLAFIKPVLKIAVIAGAFFTIYFIAAKYKPVAFAGKWKVEQMQRNGMPVDENEWLNNRHAWKYIYIERFGLMSMSPNPYVYDKERAMSATYIYDDNKKVLQMIYKKQDTQPDTSFITITNISKDKMEWNTIYYGETLKMILSKAESAAN